MNKEQKAEVALIRQRIREEPAFAVHVFRTIWDRQQPREKYSHTHLGHDGKGFRDYETQELCALHDRLEDQGWMFNASQITKLQTRTTPYAGQFWRSIQERESKEAPDPTRSNPGAPEATERPQRRKHGRIRNLSEEEKQKIAQRLERMAG